MQYFDPALFLADLIDETARNNDKTFLTDIR